MRLSAEKVALDADSAAAVKAELKGDRGGLSTFFQSFIDRLRDRDQYWERKKYTTTLNKLHGALGEHVSWSDLTPKALDKLERYCREERDNNANTTRKELSRVRRVVNQAIKEGVIRAGDDPFLRYDLPKGVPPDRRRLSLEEVEALKALEVPLRSDLQRDRDAFLFAFYGGGIRFSDVCCLKPSMIHNGRLRYRMMKTDQLVRLQLPDPALQIVDRWQDAHENPFLFPYLKKGDDRDPVHLRKRIAVWNQMANRHLKELAEQAEIRAPDDVTTHVARHSFANLARRSSKDIYAVSKALGHGDVKTTERYLAAFDQEAVDHLTESMWNDE